MNVDISNLSYEELADLEKKIIKEKKCKQPFSKAEVGMKIWNCGLNEKLELRYGNENFELQEYEILDCIRAVRESVLVICDYVLGNTVIKRNSRYPIARNPGVIKDELASKYYAMADDLVEVIKKYM